MMKPQRYESETTAGEKSRVIVCKTCTANCRMVYEPRSGKLTGNRCPRGEAYAKAYEPDAVVVRTYLVRVENGHMKRMAVRTEASISDQLSEIVEDALKSMAVTAPVEAGVTVFRNVGGSGVDLIATRKMPARLNKKTP